MSAGPTVHPGGTHGCLGASGRSALGAVGLQAVPGSSPQVSGGPRASGGPRVVPAGPPQLWVPGSSRRCPPWASSGGTRERPGVLRWSPWVPAVLRYQSCM
ncbi:hypothetical protein FKM82_020907 [Ascaphus truei]